MSINQLGKSREKMEQINQLPEKKSLIDCVGTLLAAKGPRFEERYKRITLYLENDVFAELQAIRSQGISQTNIVNTAVKEFIRNHWFNQPQMLV